MKRALIKFIFLSVIMLSLMTRHVYPIDSLIIETDDFKLYYLGKAQSLNELKNKFWAGYSFVNIPIDPSFYVLEYPNPHSPSMIKSNFVYELSHYSSVNISIIDNRDSVLFNLTLEKQPKGFCRFMFKDEYFMRPSINRRVLYSFENIRIVFVIEESKFIFPLRNINIDKPN